MTPVDYEYLRKLLKERSGLVLSADKQYLLESRLLPIARKQGFRELGELVATLRGTGAERLKVEIVEAMATNESFFLRDKLPFDHFRDTIMPALMAARAGERKIRIWCAACSTGQEPYSLAMLLHAMQAELQGWNIEILATDFSHAVLERAQSGSYTHFEVQRGLPIQLLLKHFTKEGERWKIAPEIHEMVKFQPLNLLHAFNHLGRFDVIFCRNVLIYFDRPTKTDLLERLARATERDGYLVLGATESVVGLSKAWDIMPDKRGLSQPRRRDASDILAPVPGRPAMLHAVP